MLLNESCINLDLRSLRKLPDELQIRLVGKSPGKPQEWLLEVVIAPGAEVIVLQVALAMKLDVLRLDLAILYIDFVSYQDDWDVLTHTHDIAMPIGHILVCDARRHIEHDDGTLALDVIAITKTAKLFLTRCVPNIEAQVSTVRGELEWVHFYT